jgi:hypothetical protein
MSISQSVTPKYRRFLLMAVRPDSYWYLTCTYTHAHTHTHTVRYSTVDTYSSTVQARVIYNGLDAM